jgi:hypothetical protein
MFEMTPNRILYLVEDRRTDAESLFRHCLDDAQRWELRRRAARPYRGPSRLPVVARG